MSVFHRVPLPLRSAAKVSAATVGAFLAHEILAWSLAAVGITARLLSPSPSAMTWVALALLLVLYLLRFVLVFVAPATLVVVVLRGVLELLASGNDLPEAAAPARPPRPRPAPPK